MPDQTRPAGVRTRRSTNKRPASGTIEDHKGVIETRSNATALPFGGFKRTPLSFGNPQADDNPAQRREQPCRLCKEMCEKTILAQREDLMSLRRENARLNEALQKIQNRVHLHHAASSEEIRGITVSLNDCQEKLQRFLASFTSLPNQPQFKDAHSDVPQAFAAGNPTWTYEPAPANAEATTNADGFDEDLFAIDHGNLFGLDQTTPINLSAGDYQA